MLDGWYCRTLANEQAAQNNHNNDDSGSDESQEGEEHFDTEIDYKTQYKYLKKKLKLLIYENEFFQNSLRSSQRRLLKVSRDKSFLLDRLLQYEKPEGSSSESDETESSDEENSKVETKKRKIDNPGNSSNTGKNNNNGKKRKVVQPKIKHQQAIQQTGTSTTHNQDGHMTAEEVERHLQSRQSITELVPERAPPTVPNEMFSNEPSLDRSNPNPILSPTSLVSSNEEEFAGFEDNNIAGEFVPLDERNQDVIKNCFENISFKLNQMISSSKRLRATWVKNA